MFLEGVSCRVVLIFRASADTGAHSADLVSTLEFCLVSIALYLALILEFQNITETIDKEESCSFCYYWVFHEPCKL